MVHVFTGYLVCIFSFKSSCYVYLMDAFLVTYIMYLCFDRSFLFANHLLRNIPILFCAFTVIVLVLNGSFLPICFLFQFVCSSVFIPLLCALLSPLFVRSVTRFGKNPPLWQIFKNIWHYISGLFGFGQSFELTLAQFVCFWANFHCCKWTNIENIILSSGHTVPDIPLDVLLW